MKTVYKIFFSLITIISVHNTEAQKPCIDSLVYWKWPIIQNAKISNDGRFALFDVIRPQTLVVKSTFDNWEKRFLNVSAWDAFFNEKSSQLVTLTSGDSLCFLRLWTDSAIYIPSVSSFKIRKKNNNEFIAYKLNDLGETLVLLNISNGSSHQFKHVTNYYFLTSGELLLIKKQMDSGNAVNDIDWVNVENGAESRIWSGGSLGKIAFDSSGGQVAFIGQKDNEKKDGFCLYYYRRGLDAAKALVSTDDFEPGLSILPNECFFSKSNDRLFFKMANSKNVVHTDAAGVQIWNYSDAKLKSQQIWETSRQDYYQIWKVYNLSSNKIISLANEGETVVSSPEEENGKYLLVRGPGCDLSEWHWNKQNIPTTFLVSTENGSRISMPKEASLGMYQLSPNGKYVIYYLAESQSYYCFETVTGKRRNITQKISGRWTVKNEWPSDKYTPFFSLVWTENDAKVIILDENDIWEIDPLCKQTPVCITNQYGGKHNMKFLLMNDRSVVPLRYGEKVFLQAFDRQTKENGIYYAKLGAAESPHKLIMGPYVYCWEMIQGGSFPVIKARDSNAFLLRRMSAQEAPNLFFTTDFNTFKPISDIAPQKKYNWFTAELVHWKTIDGKISDGILYKPENFDPNKQYPLIFYIYEQFSDELHLFKMPNPTGFGLNIPYFASNDYLVFVPDIHYNIGHPGKSALNYVESAVKYFAKYPWVDKSRIGIQGHSFGGFETNYIITHSKLFSAACSAAGMSDFISAYGSIIGNGTSRQRSYEFYRDRIGTSLWERPDLFLENSPVLQADKVMTPLLLMSNKMDGDVPYTQGVEFFTALRRLNKKVWMLEYANEGHQLTNPKNSEDFDNRMMQFFDYYLKQKNQPVWMFESGDRFNFSSVASPMRDRKPL